MSVPRSATRLDGCSIRAVLFDVDGTLYRQRPLQARLAVEIALDGLRTGSVAHVRRLARIIRTFRLVREELRACGEPADGLLGDMQFAATADRVGLDVRHIERAVDEWVMRRPLRHLRRAMRPGLSPLLDELSRRRIQLGVLSDYPAGAKLDAMGIAPRFSITLSTADPSINAFKPHPKGFRRACDIWGLTPEEVLYVGDREDVDGHGAAAAGMRCFLVGRGAHVGGYAAGTLADVGRALAP